MMNSLPKQHGEMMIEERSRHKSRDFYEYLSRFVTEHKLELFQQIVQQRTRHFTVVLEDIYRSHNASACLRSCECFGVQDVHIIENRHKYRTNSDVARGSSRWLTLIHHNHEEHNTLPCINTLKEQGYRVVATSPHAEGCLLEDYNVTQKTALMFGTEMDGLSSTAMEHVDEVLHIPTCGFTGSFNLSVAVALCLHHFTLKLRESDVAWQLSAEEQFELKFEWVRQAARRWLPQLEKEFYAQNDNSTV